MITRRGLWFIEDYPLEEGIELSEENPRIFPSTYRSMLTQGYPTTYSKKALELLRSYRPPPVTKDMTKEELFRAGIGSQFWNSELTSGTPVFYFSEADKECLELVALGVFLGAAFGTLLGLGTRPPRRLGTGTQLKYMTKRVMFPARMFAFIFGMSMFLQVAGQTLWASFSKKHKKIGDTVSKWLIL